MNNMSLRRPNGNEVAFIVWARTASMPYHGYTNGNEVAFILWARTASMSYHGYTNQSIS
jgi:hypothetical protein